MTTAYVAYPDGEVIRTDSPEVFTGATRISPKAEGERRYLKQTRARLLAMLAPNDRVYTCLRNVSSSGMSRRISVHIITATDASEGKPYIRDISHLVADLTGFRLAKHGDGLQIGGCGMDMGFHVVYQLGQAMWPEGTPEPHGTRNGEPDRAGGYALKQQWL